MVCIPCACFSNLWCKLAGRQQAFPQNLASSPEVPLDTHLAARSKTSEIRPPLEPLRERLWNEAYDNLKDRDTELVKAYEKVLSVHLRSIDTGSVVGEPTENEISEAQGARNSQMERIIQHGLNKTKNEASIKQEVSKVMYPWGLIFLISGGGSKPRLAEEHCKLLV